MEITKIIEYVLSLPKSVSWNTTIMDTDWHRVENVITKEIFDK